MKVEYNMDSALKKIKEMEDNLKKLEKAKLKIGVLSKDSELQMIAKVHEYGKTISVTPKMRAWFAYQGYPLKASTTTIVIPERSFLRTGKKNNAKKIAKKTITMMPKVITGGVPIRLFLEELGEEYAGYIQKDMKKLNVEPNSPMTKERKGSSTPLIDTGRLVGAIESEVTGI